MAQLTLKINGYAYTLACENGQEAHLQEMAREVEARIEANRPIGGAAGEGRALVLAALLMADELHDLTAEMAVLRRQLSLAPGGAGAAPSAEAEALDAKSVKRIARLARKAEDIAAGLDQP